MQENIVAIAKQRARIASLQEEVNKAKAGENGQVAYDFAQVPQVQCFKCHKLSRILMTYRLTVTRVIQQQQLLSNSSHDCYKRQHSSLSDNLMLPMNRTRHAATSTFGIHMPQANTVNPKSCGCGLLHMSNGTV